MTSLPPQYCSPPLRDGGAAGPQAEHGQCIANASAEEGQQHQKHQVPNHKNGGNQGLEAWKSMRCILQDVTSALPASSPTLLTSPLTNLTYQPPHQPPYQPPHQPHLPASSPNSFTSLFH